MPATTTSARGTVLRGVLLFTPFLIVTLGAFGYIAADVVERGVNAGGIVGLVLVGSVALLLAYQVVQSVRDLFAKTVETTGVVERQWKRNDFIVFRNTYIFVERNVFRLEPEMALQIELGTRVRVVHYPHTSTVEAIEVLPQPVQQGTGGDG